MTNPPIWTVDWETLQTVRETGKPAGLFTAAEPGGRRSWCGVDSRFGKPVVRKRGLLPEVLDWLFVRAKIAKRGEAPVVREAGGEHLRPRSGGTGIPVRIPGAEITEWEAGPGRPRRVRRQELPEDEDSPNRPGYHGGWGGGTLYPVPKKEPRRQGRPKGTGTGITENTVRLDRQIRQMVIDGMSTEEIAARVERSKNTVRRRIGEIRKAGGFPNDVLPPWRVRQFQEQDENKRRRGLRVEESES